MPCEETSLLNVPIRTARFLPSAFTTLTRAVVLFVLIGLVSVSTPKTHQAEAPSSLAVQAAEIVPLHECCHGTDQAAQHKDCVLSMCCSVSALAGNVGRNMPSAAAASKLLIGPLSFASLSFPPILHPPIII